MRRRPAGITILAAAFAAIVLFLFVSGALVLIGQVPLMIAASLLGGLEIMGPAVFFIAATILTVVSLGLWRLNRFARRASVAIAAALLLGSVASISSAVVDVRVLALVREGAKIIVSIVAIRYLYDPDVSSAFQPESPTLPSLGLARPKPH